MLKIFSLFILIACCLTFGANSYSAPNFNIDASTNVAGLTTLKGSAPALTDKIYVYNSATLTIESALSILLITLGQTSAGAATDGQRRGYVVVNAGVTITFAGNATQTNSGIVCNPTSAPGTAGESRSCMVYCNGTPTSRIVMTNSVGSSNTANRWGINMTYGALVMQCVDMNYTYLAPIGVNINTTYADTNNNCDDITSTTQTQGTNVASFVNVISNVVYNRAARFTRLNLPAPVSSGTVLLMYNVGTGSYMSTGADIILSGFAGGTSISTTYGGPVSFNYMRNNTGVYFNTQRFSVNDIRPNATIPTGLTLSDLKDGTIKITISNITSYADSDRIFIYDSLGNTINSFSKKMYTTDGTTTVGIKRKPANCAIIAGASLQSLTGIYAKASSDNYQFSFPSATASVTSSFLPAVDSVIGAHYGQSGNEFTGTATLPAAGNVLTGSGLFGVSGNSVTPTLTLPAAGNVLTGSGLFGNPSSQTTPTLTLPSENYVDNTRATFGNPSSPKTPNLVTPLESSVKNGVSYGPSSGSLTGTAPDTCGAGTATAIKKQSFKNY